MVELENILWIGNYLKARNALQRVRTIHRDSTRGDAHTLGGRLNSNCLGPYGCLVLSQASGSITGSSSVRSDPA